MKTVPLGEVADFINGVAFKPEDWHDSGLPIIRIQNLTDPNKPINLTNRQVHDKYKVRRGDILVSWSATLGVFTWDRTDEALVNQHIFRVLPHASVIEREYLKHILQGALVSMEQHLHGATMKHVNRSEFLATRIPLPPLDEQRWIAEILDQADLLRNSREQVIAQLDELGPSIFLEMFGHYSGQFVTVAEVAERAKGSIRTGPFGSQLLHSEFVEQGIAVLGLDNVVGNAFSWGERRYITHEKYQDLKRYTVRPGDVLVSIMGTCGRCVVVPADIGTAINTKHICAITVDPTIATPEFVRAAFLWHPRSRHHLSQRTKGSIMDGLNMGIVKEMPLPLPPLDEQRKFVDRLRQEEEHRMVCAESSTSLNYLFESLQARAFAGEL